MMKENRQNLEESRNQLLSDVYAGTFSGMSAII